MRSDDANGTVPRSRDEDLSPITPGPIELKQHAQGSRLDGSSVSNSTLWLPECSNKRDKDKEMRRARSVTLKSMDQARTAKAALTYAFLHEICRYVIFPILDPFKD